MIDSLKNSEGFLEIISKGQKFTISGLTFYFLKKNNVDQSKVGISIKKKSGSAVYHVLFVSLECSISHKFEEKAIKTVLVVS